MDANKYHLGFVFHTRAFNTKALRAAVKDDTIHIAPVREFFNAHAQRLAAKKPIVLFLDYKTFAEQQTLFLSLSEDTTHVKIVLYIGSEDIVDETLVAMKAVFSVNAFPAYDYTLCKDVESVFAYLRLRNVQTYYKGQLEQISNQLYELNNIGIALSAETDVNRLLSLILVKSKELTSADAACLYLVEEGRETIRFKLSDNDSSGADYTEFVMPINKKSIAGYVALTGETLILDDAYAIPKESEYHLNRSFDEKTGYRTKSLLVTPMRNHKGIVTGVLQLINRKNEKKKVLRTREDFEAHVIPFNRSATGLVQSMASQASVALENAILYDNLETIFEHFVTACVSAIESRDPATSGHTARVTEYTVALAKAIDAIEEGPYANAHFSESELRELHFAAILHDFGKIGVREKVLTKKKKLYYGEHETLAARIAYVKQLLRADTEERKVTTIKESASYAEVEPAIRECDARLQEDLAKLDRYLDIIETSNEPKPLAEEAAHELDEIARYEYRNEAGETRTLITDAEYAALSLPRGNLSQEERAEMETHVLFTRAFLEKIPWSSNLQRVPAIAAQHHERLDGSGYPRHLKGENIPLQARILMLTDVYDSLTASDRPYKKPIPPDRALTIIEEEEVRKGRMDEEVFRIFKEKEIYRLVETLR